MLSPYVKQGVPFVVQGRLSAEATIILQFHVAMQFLTMLLFNMNGWPGGFSGIQAVEKRAPGFPFGWQIAVVVLLCEGAFAEQPWGWSWASGEFGQPEVFG